MSEEGGSAVGLPASADKLAPEAAFPCFCSQVWDFALLSICFSWCLPSARLSHLFLHLAIKWQEEKRAFVKAHVLNVYFPSHTAISPIPICIRIFQKRSPSSA